MEAIQSTIEIEDYNTISTTDPKIAFESLIKDHGSQSGLLTAGVIAQISSIKLQPGASLDDILVLVQSLHKELDSYVSEDIELRISSNILAIFLLNGLSLVFDNIVQTFLNQMETFNVSEVKIRLRMESARHSNPLAVTPLTAHASSSSQRISVNKRGVVIGPNPSDGCNYPGHDEMYHTNLKCRVQHPELGPLLSSDSLTLAQKAKKWEEHEKANAVTSHVLTSVDPVSATAAMVKADFPPFEAFGYTTSHSSPTVIFLDSACTRHMVNNKNLFVSLFQIMGVPIDGAFGTGDSAEYMGTIVGPGILKGKTVNVMISNVLFCPTLKANLISLGQLSDEGCSWTGNEKTLRIEGFPDGISICGHRLSSCGLYEIQVSPRLPDFCHIARTEKWHARFAHLNYTSIRHLMKKGLIKASSVEGGHDDSCVIFQKSKISRAPFPSRFPIATPPLFRIHSDVMGPLPSSVGGAHYIVSFIDDHTRLATIYIMKCKSEVLSCFDHYKRKMENVLQRRIKFLRSDRGGEYMSEDFASYLIKAGIQYERAPANTPQHNSVAERFNRTLMERLRCVLLAANLPIGLWAEVAQGIVYILNRSPDSTIERELPIQKWLSAVPGSGLNQPNLSFL